MPLLAGSISFQDAHSGAGLIPLFRRRLFEILEFISTLISACRRMSSGLSQAALWSCASCAAFGDWFRRLSISHWSLHLFYRGWITAMRHWLASRPACLTVSSLSSTRLSSLLQTLWPVFTGYEHPSALSSSWRLSSTKLSMVPHLSTYRISCSTLPIYRRDAVVASAHRLPVSRRPLVTMCYCRQSVVCYCRPSTLEQSTC